MLVVLNLPPILRIFLLHFGTGMMVWDFVSHYFSVRLNLVHNVCDYNTQLKFEIDCYFFSDSRVIRLFTLAESGGIRVQ